MRPVDDKAVGIGVAVGVAFVFLGMGLGRLVPLIGSGPDAGLMWLFWAMRALGVVGKACAGFSAGWVARRDGALHGAIVGAVVAALGVAIGIGSNVARGNGHYYAGANVMLWVQIVGWAAVGVAVAAVAGHVAARLRR